MHSAATFITASDAARRLGVSSKALRLYEQRGLIAPGRTASGWRVYGPQDMERLRDIVALRSLGMTIAQTARVLNGDSDTLDTALLALQTRLEADAGRLADSLTRVRDLRAALLRGNTLATGALVGLLDATRGPQLAFPLPWPWDGEPFVLHDIMPITYIIGPLGSGKTRLAMTIAEKLPGARFIGLDRRADSALLSADAALGAQVVQMQALLTEDGATPSDALTATLIALAGDGSALVIDMIEQGLDQATQEALIAHLRHRRVDPRPLFLLTRSSAILDLTATGGSEAIILCPANHSPPVRVVPLPGAAGYEAVATCLASPHVRARTAGMIACLPPASWQVGSECVKVQASGNSHAGSRPRPAVP